MFEINYERIKVNMGFLFNLLLFYEQAIRQSIYQLEECSHHIIYTQTTDDD